MLSRGGAVVVVVLSWCALAGSTRPSWAAPATTVFHIQQQSLSNALIAFAHQANVEILVDPALVRNLNARPVHARLSVEDALTKILAGSGIGFRATGPGEFALFALHLKRAVDPGEPTEVGAVAEILVVGRHSQNVDIPRSENDIQPYQVATRDIIAASQSQTVEEFLRDRVLDDSASPASVQEPGPASGNATSQVNLRGLGLAQTLVLLDGRRLPTISLQPDINGIPPSAIDRIETLTSTAGGIYGPDAIGGVVNVVLKRDYQGGVLSVSSGETTRGDAPDWRADGALGLSSSATGTQVMLSLSHAETAGLDFGSRAFVEAAHVLTITRTPFSIFSPVAGQVNVSSDDGNPLTLVSGLGGGSLGSTISHLPLSVALSGSGNEAALLRANAGAYDLSLSPDGQGALQTLLTPTVTNSLIFSLRQPIGSRFEAFLDLDYFDDQGTATASSVSTSNILLNPGAPGDPFQNPVFVSFPTPGLSSKSVTTDRTGRATLGVIANLTRTWTGEFDLTLGEASQTSRSQAEGPIITVTPFEGPSAVAAALAYRPQQVINKLDDRLVDLNLRLAGPLLQLPGGPLTMTLLGELRSDRPPSTPLFNIDAAPENEGQSTLTPSRVQVVSAYAEARAPLIGMNSALPLLRGLELQLALREDSTTTRVGQPFFAVIDEGSSDTVPETIFTDSERVLKPHKTTGSVTFGAQVFPIQGVMLRGSFATGYLPVTANPMAESFNVAASAEGIFGLTDPRRGGQTIGTQGPVVEEDFGDPNPKPEFAQTVSVGIVLNPSWLRGLRLSVDYSRTDTSRGITINSTPDLQYLLNNESVYPGRITRAPLTAADAEAGDLAGVVTAINFSPLNIARSTEESVRIQLDYSRDTPLGAVHFYGEATWEPNLTFLNDPTQPAYNVAGDSDGPLRWRGAVGVDWTHGRWKMGVNAQIYGGYSEKIGFPLQAAFNGPDVQLQGNDQIPAQGYIDIVIAYRSIVRISGLGSQTIEYRLGLKNVLDQTPPLVVAPEPGFETIGYSPYGDPRGRRFEFTATARF